MISIQMNIEIIQTFTIP